MFIYFYGIGFLSILLFVLRLWFFYKHGVNFAKTNEKLPRLLDVQLVFLGIGVFGTWLASCIPFISFIMFIIVLILFIRLNKELLTITDLKKVTPEKMLRAGIGLGLAGVIGFLLGFYRGSAYKDDE